jgi:hypothetical protein
MMYEEPESEYAYTTDGLLIDVSSGVIDTQD